MKLRGGKKERSTWCRKSSARQQNVSGWINGYGNSGTKVWTTQILAVGKVVSDAAGNVFVAGAIFNNDTTDPSDYLVSKLSPAGQLVFQTRINRGDEPSDATVDPFGNLLMTGNALNSQFQHDIFTVRVK